MGRKRKNKKEPLVKYARGILIEPTLLKARSVRKSLLSRISSELKSTTPEIKELHKWLTLPNYMCFYCLKPLELVDIVIDHKTPIARNGSNSISNLCVCCKSCNQVKGNLNEEEFRSLMELVKSWDDHGESLFIRLQLGFFPNKKRD